jgi:hypothetical protein
MKGEVRWEGEVVQVGVVVQETRVFECLGRGSPEVRLKLESLEMF